VKVAIGVHGIASPQWSGPTDLAAAPTGKPRTTTVEPCLTTEEFKQVADRKGSTIFEGNTIRLTVSGPVVCQAGWAYAPVTGYSIDWVILRYQGGTWDWAVDPYWNQFGEKLDLCTAMPAKIRTALRC
jgi:hypothetical protein